MPGVLKAFLKEKKTFLLGCGRIKFGLFRFVRVCLSSPTFKVLPRVGGSDVVLTSVCSAAAFPRRDGAARQREEPVFAANIPFKVALFAALTGHEYQAEGAGGAADAHRRAAGTF